MDIIPTTDPRQKYSNAFFIDSKSHASMLVSEQNKRKPVCGVSTRRPQKFTCLFIYNCEIFKMRYFSHCETYLFAMGMKKELTVAQRSTIFYCQQRGNSYRKIAETVGCSL